MGQNDEQMDLLMEKFKPSEEELHMTAVSLEQQLIKQIGDYTNLNVQFMKLQNKNSELEKELEEYRNSEIEEMDEGG